MDRVAYVYIQCTLFIMCDITSQGLVIQLGQVVLHSIAAQLIKCVIQPMNSTLINENKLNNVHLRMIHPGFTRLSNHYVLYCFRRLLILGAYFSR
jgi:hypothetical protein